MPAILWRTRALALQNRKAEPLCCSSAIPFPSDLLSALADLRLRTLSRLNPKRFNLRCAEGGT